MEGMNKLPSCCQSKRDCESRPLSTMVSSSLPLTSGSFQVLKKPYFINHGGSGASSSGTKPYHPVSDLKTTLLPMVNDHHNNKKRQKPSLPSDKNLIPSDDSISVKIEPTGGASTRWCRNLDPNMDPKKLRRIISNRVSAQKSRMKKLQYVTDMERKVKALEAQIAVLNPQVVLYKNHQEMLEMEQKRLNQRMVTYANKSVLRDVEIEENKAEVNRLRQLHLTQQQEKTQAQIRMHAWESSGLEEIINPSINRFGQGQMVYMNSNQGQSGENTVEMNRLKQFKPKQLAAQCDNDKAETNGHDPLNMNLLQQQNPGQLLMPSWEPGQVQIMNQSVSPQRENMNLSLGGIEQILSLNLSQHGSFM